MRAWTSAQLWQMDTYVEKGDEQLASRTACARSQAKKSGEEKRQWSLFFDFQYASVFRAFLIVPTRRSLLVCVLLQTSQCLSRARAHKEAEEASIQWRRRCCAFTCQLLWSPGRDTMPGRHCAASAAARGAGHLYVCTS